MILNDLRRLSSAEELFEYLGVSYDPAVLRVARLHILKRLGQYLAHTPLAELEESEVRRRCVELLQTAYEDFRRSTPLEQRVFKVLRDAVEPKQKRSFIPLESLGRS